MGEKTFLRKLWYFIWEDDSVWSWLVNVILAFVLIKFLVYPGLGLAFGTKFPIVAVISSSMEHDGSFESWWGSQQEWYAAHNLSEAQFRTFRFQNGFNKGDIMVLIGRDPEKITVGDVIVYASTLRPEPIIHRVVKITGGIFQTKGDHNPDTFPFEQAIYPQQIYGKAVLRIPFLGYVKIIAVELLNMVR